MIAGAEGNDNLIEFHGGVSLSASLFSGRKTMNFFRAPIKKSKNKIPVSPSFRAPPIRVHQKPVHALPLLKTAIHLLLI